MTTDHRTLLLDYDGLADALLRLTSREGSAIDDVREAFSTGDPKQLDTALASLIRTAQAARKIIKAGPPATATCSGHRVGDEVEVPWGSDQTRRGVITVLRRDGSEAIVRVGNTESWVPDAQIIKL